MTEPSSAAVQRDPAPRPTAAATVVLALVHGYKLLLSPLFAGSCRFHPSCAAYMAEAVSTHGAVAGVALGLRRLARCHPWGGFGFDPVPSRGNGAGGDTESAPSTAGPGSIAVRPVGVASMNLRHLEER